MANRLYLRRLTVTLTQLHGPDLQWATVQATARNDGEGIGVDDQIVVVLKGPPDLPQVGDFLEVEVRRG